jgi:GAF domain-containing protein
VETALIVAQQPQPVDLLRALLRFAGPGFTQARLGLIDPATPTRARIIAEAEAGAVRAADYPDRISDYPGWDSLAERDAVIIPDMLADPALFPDQRDRLRARRIAGLVLIPLVNDAELLGVFIASSSAPITIEAPRVRALRSLLDFAARGLALRQMRTALTAEQERAARAARQLDSVTRLALRAGTFDDSTRLYEYAVREMVQLLKADHGGVLVLDADETAGTVVAEYPDSGALGSRLTMAGNALFDVVRAQRSAVIANRVMDDPRMLPDTRAVFEKLGLHSLMLIPIVQGGRIVASIGMDLFTSEREFDQDVADTANAMSAQVSGALENIQRAAQLARQLSAVEAMSALAASIYRIQEDERTLFDSIAGDVTRTTGSDHMVFVMIEPDGVNGRIVSEYPPRGMAGVQVELGPSVMGEPLRQLQAGVEGPIVLADLQSNPRMPEQARAMFRQFDVHSMLFVPFRVDGRLVGMAAFDRTGKANPYEPETIAVARTIGAELSVGLQNIQLVKEARRRATQLERIAEFARASQAGDTVEAVLDSMMSTLGQVVPADRIGVLFFDEGQRELRLVARTQEGAPAVQLKGGPLVAVTGTYAGQVWTTQTPLMIADTHEGAAGRPRNDTGIRSMALFPFDGGPGLRGVISVGSANPRSYGESDAAVLQQLVNQFASALESRASQAAKQASVVQESLVNTLSARYQRATDVNEMLATTLRELGDHLGAKRGRIRLAVEPAPVAQRAADHGATMDVW